ncbi:MAG: hypothetical protein WBC68_16325, partial [Albidovulum sp.]
VHDAKKFAHLPLALKNNHALDVVAHAAEGDHDNRTGQAVGQIMRASRNMLDAADAAEDLAIVSEVLEVVEGISVTISYDPSILGPEAHADIRMFETAPPSFDKPLWQSGDLAPEGWLSAKNWWRKRGTAWEFWIKWYEDLLAGIEPNWFVLKQIALIPDVIWEQGAEAVNARIELNQEQLRLAHEVATLRAAIEDVRSHVASDRQRAHNKPPELIEPTAAIQKTITLISEALAEVEEELRKPDPVPGALTRLGRLLLKAVSELTVYCASLGDVVLKKAAEEVGKSAGKLVVLAGLSLLVSRSEGVQSLAQALIEFAKSLTNAGLG